MSVILSKKDTENLLQAIEILKSLPLNTETEPKRDGTTYTINININDKPNAQEFFNQINTRLRAKGVI
jgi:hypothetical protein